MHFLVVANCCVPGYGYNTRYPVCTDVIRVTQNDFVISPISWDSSDANCTTSLEVSATIIYLNQHHFTLVFGKYLCIRCMYHSRKISLFTNSLYGTADAALTKINSLLWLKRNLSFSSLIVHTYMYQEMFPIALFNISHFSWQLWWLNKMWQPVHANHMINCTVLFQKIKKRTTTR